MDELYKLSNNELRDICDKKGVEYKIRDTKRKLVDRIKGQKGGRYYKCMKGRQTEFIEARNNPQNNATKKYSGANWICKETGLTDEKNRGCCSYELKPGMKCLPCWNKNAEKRPKECRACISGKLVYYCKKK